MTTPQQIVRRIAATAAKTKRFNATVAAILLTICWTTTLHAQRIAVYFSPNGGVANATTAEINAAKTSIHCMAYAISEPTITTALLAAKQRGVDVQLLVDPHQRNDLYSSAPKLHTKGIPTWTDASEDLHHNKVMIIDNETTITGSANFTTAADRRNAENCLVIHDATIAAKYEANFALHKAHCITFIITKHRDNIPRTKPLPSVSPTPTPTTKE